MKNRSRLPKILRETVPVLATVVAALALITMAVPAAAQFFPFFDNAPRQQRGYGGGGYGGYGGGGGWFGDPYFGPQQAPRRVVREDFSRAPPPEKRENAQPSERNVVVLGDALADWLAYGLEDAYSEQSDIGIIRRHKTVSGLIRYQPKGEPADWPAAAKSVLAPENPSAVVIMLGLNDRVALREPVKADKAGEKKPAADAAKPATPVVKPTDKPEAELADDAAEISDPPPIITPEKSVRSPTGSYEFREDRWVELYTKKIEDMIAAAKAKNVPVLWVGLPAVRGTKATADMLFLNALYRDTAQKAGVTFVDVWDGFVDDSGRYMQQGPDFEGQTRRLRSFDGVYFTKAGARKLAHYVEREIGRLLTTRSAPVEIPVEPEKPDVEAKPGGPPPRPLAGPILPLTVAAVASDQLMGGGSPRPAGGDTLVARALVKGEPLIAPPGRADDGVWPRREVGRETAPKGGDMPALASLSDGSAPPALAAAQPAAEPPKRKQFRPRPPAQAQQAPGDFFGFGGFGGGFGWQQPQQAQAQQRQRPAQQRAPSIFGPSAAAPGWFTR